jgi:3-hydroxy-9,10-secoandrosta-1,3,5(10)-triene-9,17-dione monooxygenase reductase component
MAERERVGTQADRAVTAVADAHQSNCVEIDARHFRDVLGHFCSGITIIAALDGSTPVGLTCQSFFSLSLSPALIACSVSKTSTSYPVIRSIGELSVNVLADEQYAISNAFAKSGTDKWAGVLWHRGPALGQPIIDGALASLECQIDQEVDAGDHVLAIARVRHLEAHPDRTPLLFFRGAYHGLAGRRGAHRPRLRHRPWWPGPSSVEDMQKL